MLIRVLREYLLPYYGPLALVLLLQLEANAAALYLPTLNARIIDDGIATGASMRAALKGLAQREPARIVLAVPVAPRDALEALRALVDDIVCLEMPDFFYAVGAHYREFGQVSDDEVARAMAAA